jgi:hypothetical protein
VQRCTVSRQGDLFAGAWYPNDTYNPYDDKQHLFAAAIGMKTSGIRQPAKAEIATRKSHLGKKQA